MQVRASAECKVMPRPNENSREEVLMWAFIDPLFVVVGACGVRLWREPAGAA